MKTSLMRLVKRDDGLVVQAKVCTKCEQLVLTYPQTMRCIVCGGLLAIVKKN